MTDIEIALTNVGEIATRDIAKEEHPKGLKENRNFSIFKFANTSSIFYCFF